MTANDLFVPPGWGEEPHTKGERLTAAIVATLYVTLLVALFLLTLMDSLLR